ncbi:unnamed protein product [Danaus chrysippus]|uniref:(African queen) hypothetical protein n=1 Tax=Danaus chrysippus TaxID=151541 RepID=A0A8J2VSJ6_9NEOP|nr:unnamed protein product [Danaus chrysippus]
MTLRRCDSLPTKLRVAPIGSPEVSKPLTEKIPDSITDSNLNTTLVRDEVIATWKSLHTDVKKIKNGLPTTKNTLNYRTDKGESIKNHLYPASTRNNGVAQKNPNPRNIQAGPQEVDRSSSFPLECGQRFTDKRTNSAKRRTLLERLLSWRTPDCECDNRCPPKLKPQTPEELLCTCGVANKDNQIKTTDRERSKSVGYEATREVTQFRRCASAGATVGVETASALRARAALTLARRYYPEGGWGWTITVVGTIVQILSHGLQLGGGTGAMACAASVKYRVQPLYTYGEYKQ